MKGSPKDGKTREACPPGGVDDYELARRMGISQGRVLQIRQRAMRKLRQAIEEEAAAEGLTVAEFLGWDA